MSTTKDVQVDVLIFGGGVAGLWLLDELVCRGASALLIESRSLGAGQTIASQGILHGGLKYSLRGLLSGSADAVSEMPDVWRACMSGTRRPDLRGVRVLSPCCYLWRTDSLASRLGMLGAKVSLRTPVSAVAPGDRPAPLRECPGDVLRVDEPVVDTASLLESLAAPHVPRLIRMSDPCGLVVACRKPGEVEYVQLRLPDDDREARVVPRFVVLTAGEGNEKLRRAFGLASEAMQRRPLHMLMARGNLPPLFGHCVDGDKTRVTITSTTDAAGRTVWNIGGEIAERGTDMDEGELIAWGRKEIAAVLPTVRLESTQWAGYRIDRAEGRTASGLRPAGSVWRRDGNVVTAWPTKLVLAPRLAKEIADGLGFRGSETASLPPPLPFPRPAVAQPPWEVSRTWHS